MLTIALAAAPGGFAEPAPVDASDTDGTSVMAPDDAVGPDEDKARADGRGVRRSVDADSYERQSFWFIGTSNYHLRLEESERKIDRMIDGPFRWVLPGWERPTTFKDWSDDWKIWDLWVGYGTDLSPKWSWSVYSGGGAGTIANGRRYLPLALRLDVDFTRRSVMAGTSVTYYPFGKPSYRGGSYRELFKAIRPMLEMNVGATRQTVIGEVRASLPLAGEVLRIEDKEAFSLLWASPRAGIEVPLSESNSLNILGGYLFFHEHAAEFNGALFEVFVRHRF